MSSLSSLLERLSNAVGVPGSEFEVREIIREELEPHMDKVYSDRLGNIIAFRASPEPKKRVMLAAHMDEVGFMVKLIDDDGFIKFTKLGGIDDRVLPAQRVVLHTEKGSRVLGIIGSKPPHIMKKEERKKVIEEKDLFIDIGARDKKEVEKMGVKIGDIITFDVEFSRLTSDVVAGKAFDDRAGCAALIEAVRKLGGVELGCDLYAVGTIQEEVGLRGAGTSAFDIYPDVAVALDVTVAGGTPGVKPFEAPIRMRKGPSITVADRGLIAHPTVFRQLIEAAEEAKVPYQIETGLPGSTDAAKISLTRGGVPSGVISIPTRYIHGPVSTLSLMDLEASSKIAVEFLKRVS